MSCIQKIMAGQGLRPCALPGPAVPPCRISCHHPHAQRHCAGQLANCAAESYSLLARGYFQAAAVLSVWTASHQFFLQAVFAAMVPGQHNWPLAVFPACMQHAQAAMCCALLPACLPACTLGASAPCPAATCQHEKSLLPRPAPQWRCCTLAAMACSTACCRWARCMP